MLSIYLHYVKYPSGIILPTSINVLPSWVTKINCQGQMKVTDIISFHLLLHCARLSLHLKHQQQTIYLHCSSLNWNSKFHMWVTDSKDASMTTTYFWENLRLCKFLYKNYGIPFISGFRFQISCFSKLLIFHVFHCTSWVLYQVF